MFQVLIYEPKEMSESHCQVFPDISMSSSNKRGPQLQASSGWEQSFAF